jgi:Cu-processing system permease protein
MGTGKLHEDRRASADGTEAPRTSGVGAIAADRLRRRFASRRFLVLLGVYAVVVLVLTMLSAFVAWAMAALSGGADTGPLIFSSAVFWVLLLAIVAGPAVQGRALEAPVLLGRSAERVADEERATSSPSGRVFGVLLAEWATSLVFVAIALPVLLVVAVTGGVAAPVVIGSLVIVTVEILLLGAITVGVSGLTARPGRSVIAAYGVVAGLTVGTILVFAFVGNLVRHEVVTENRGVSWSSTELIADCDEAFAEGASDCVEDADGQGVTTCEAWQRTTSERARLDLAWWVLAVNPFVLVSDATPLTWQGSMQGPADLFGMVTSGVRQAQIADETTETLDACTIDGQDEASTVPALVERTASSWYLGLLAQAALAAGLLLGAVSRAKRRTAMPGRTS